MTQTDKDVHISNINSAKKKKKKDNWFLHSSRFYCLKVTKKVKFFCINNTVISLKTENVQL